MVGRHRRGAGALALVVVLAGVLVDVAPTLAADDETATITETVEEGDTVRTDGARVVPTTGNRILAILTTAADGEVTFTKNEDPAAVTGYRPLAEVAITAPTATAAQPHHLTLSAYVGSLPTGVPLASLAVLRDGTPVPTCLSTIAASPDPCLLTRTATSTAMTVTALTSAASTWTIARSVLERVTPESTATSDPAAIAIAASRRAFPLGAASAVVLARVDDFADALAGAPLAGARVAPLLLTSSDALDDATLDEITRVLPSGGVVYVLGGEAAVSSAVAQRLRSWGYLVVRYAGADRYATAVVIAESALHSPDAVVETTGTNFADALAAGAVAGHIGGAVLLTDGAEQSPATAAYLREHHPTRYAVGGPSASADPGATSFVGRDRTETAVLAARHFFASPTFLTMASGYAYADAVTAAAYAAIDDSPLLLLPASGELPTAVGIYLRELGSVHPTAMLVGSVSNVADDVKVAVGTELGI